MGFSCRPMLILELARSFEGRFLSGFPLGAGTCVLVTTGVFSFLDFSGSLEVDTGAAGATLRLLEASPRFEEVRGREMFRFLLA